MAKPAVVVDGKQWYLIIKLHAHKIAHYYMDNEQPRKAKSVMVLLDVLGGDAAKSDYSTESVALLRDGISCFEPPKGAGI